MSFKVGLTFPKVADASGASEATCRRYAKRAPRLFLARTRAGVTRFPEAAVERFQAAHEGMKAGLRWQEVESLLQERFGLVHEVETEVEVYKAVGASGAQDILSKLTDALAAIADQKTRIESLETSLIVEAQERQAMEQKLRVLEAELVQGKRRQREFERSMDKKYNRSTGKNDEK